MNKQLVVGLLSLFWLVAFSFCLNSFVQFPFLCGGDAGYYVIQAENALNLRSVGGEPPLFFFFSAIVSLLTGNVITGIMISSSFISACLVLAFFVLGKELTGKDEVALSLAFFGGFNSFSSMLGCAFHKNLLAIFLSVICALFLIRFIKRDKPSDLVLCFLLLFLVTASHYSTAIILFSSLSLFILSSVWFDRKLFFKLLPVVGCILFLGGCVLVIRNGDLFWDGGMGWLTINTLEHLEETQILTFKQFLLGTYLGLMPFVAMGIEKLRNEDKRVMFFMVSWITGSLVIASPFFVAAHYGIFRPLFSAQLPIMFCAGVGLKVLLEEKKKVFLTTVLLFALLFSIHFYFGLMWRSPVITVKEFYGLERFAEQNPGAVVCGTTKEKYWIIHKGIELHNSSFEEQNCSHYIHMINNQVFYYQMPEKYPCVCNDYSPIVGVEDCFGNLVITRKEVFVYGKT